MPRKKVADMEWYAIYADGNSGEVLPFNIFEHSGFFNDIKKYAKKCKTKEEFLNELRISLFYYFGSKCEWEVVVEAWVGNKDKPRKIDVYQQVRANWHVFTEYVCSYLWKE